MFMLRNPQYDSVKIVLLIIVIGFAGLFAYDNFGNAGDTALVLNTTVPIPTTQNSPISGIWIYGIGGSGNQGDVVHSTNASATAWAFAGLQPLGMATGIATNGMFFANALREFGYSEFPAPNSTDVPHYSADGINWLTNANPGWFPRNAYNALATPSAAYVLDGLVYQNSTYDTMANDVWATTNGVTWTRKTASAAWPARWSAMTAYYNNKIFIMGGKLGPYKNTPVNDVWSSADGGTTWNETTVHAAWSNRSGATVLSFNNKMYLIGGFQGGCGQSQQCNAHPGMSDVWSTTDDGANWTLVVDNAPWGVNSAGVQSGRSDHCSVVFNNQMWVIGGVGSDNDYYTDAWSSSDGVHWTKQADLSSMPQISAAQQSLMSPICTVATIPVVTNNRTANINPAINQSAQQSQ